MLKNRSTSRQTAFSLYEKSVNVRNWANKCKGNPEESRISAACCASNNQQYFPPDYLGKLTMQINAMVVIVEMLSTTESLKRGSCVIDRSEVAKVYDTGLIAV